MQNINPKKFPIGSVVYFVERHSGMGYNDTVVVYGTVEEHYIDTIAIQRYELRDMRLINGIPIKDFVTPTEWKKLPKGWSYDTKLFDISFAEYPCHPSTYNIKKPDDILKAISDGVLVKAIENEHSHIEAEIDKRYGWRIDRHYPNYGEEYHPNYASINYRNVYDSYEEAQKVIDEYNAELKRQSELSDYDWSVEQIDETLNHWKFVCGKTDSEKEKYRQWLLSLNKVEDIEIRILSGLIQYKYVQNKRWLDIEFGE